MRRVLVGVVAVAVGVGVFAISGRRFVAIAAALALIAAADWLGLMPSPYEPSMRELLHGDGNDGKKGMGYGTREEAVIHMVDEDQQTTGVIAALTELRDLLAMHKVDAWVTHLNHETSNCLSLAVGL